MDVQAVVDQVVEVAKVITKGRRRKGKEGQPDLAVVSESPSGFWARRLIRTWQSVSDPRVRSSGGVSSALRQVVCPSCSQGQLRHGDGRNDDDYLTRTTACEGVGGQPRQPGQAHRGPMGAKVPEYMYVR